MYKTVLPLLGFENILELDIITIDDKFSTLVLNNDKTLNINIVNITYFKDVSFNFNIDDETLKKLHIHEITDFKIYFCVVMQKPIEDSIVNLVAPILINERHKLIGQYVIKDKVPKLFTSLNSTSI